jgi:23S rRNA pseudouridine1911/1915/1917 synthase
MNDTASHVETVTVAPAEAGERIDRLLAARLEGLSRSRLKALILDGHVASAPAPAAGARTIRDPGYRVNAGEAIAVTVPPP